MFRKLRLNRSGLSIKFNGNTKKLLVVDEINNKQHHYIHREYTIDIKERERKLLIFEKIGNNYFSCVFRVNDLSDEDIRYLSEYNNMLKR